MVGKTGTHSKRKYLKVQNNSILFVLCFLLSGCGTINTFTDTQKSLNRDYTMVELARISALVEIVKTTDDPLVKIEAVKALRELQKTKP